MARIINGKLVRTCTVCEITSETVRFFKQKSRGKLYERNICIPCKREKYMDVREKSVKTAESIRKRDAYAKEYRRKNKKRISEQRKHYRELNKEWLKQQRNKEMV